MAYLVKITLRAELDLALLYERIRCDHSDASLNWYFGLKLAISTLEEFPNRCPKTPENGQHRHLLYGHNPHVYRVIYRVLENRHLVEILHISHGRQQAFSPTDPD